ncbi:hypothetical protein [Herbaspirillum sp. ST 5-3]|uniref:hypothetical protein n=1 Tax=Oxalobacteraceae TaxID=75682 RepID=UPI0014560079|nr:hypothetical protein [Herbaspirillum sp. ST 5-3]
MKTIPVAERGELSSRKLRFFQGWPKPECITFSLRFVFLETFAKGAMNAVFLVTGIMTYSKAGAYPI